MSRGEHRLDEQVCSITIMKIRPQITTNTHDQFVGLSRCLYTNVVRSEC